MDAIPWNILSWLSFGLFLVFFLLRRGSLAAEREVWIGDQAEILKGLWIDYDGRGVQIVLDYENWD